MCWWCCIPARWRAGSISSWRSRGSSPVGRGPGPRRWRTRSRTRCRAFAAPPSCWSPTSARRTKPLVKLICDEADRIVAAGRPDGGVRRDRRRSTAAPVNIHQVLEHVRRVAEAGFARQHRFVELYDPSLPEVDGDRDKLIQVFLNLVKNAAEATPGEGGQITLVDPIPARPAHEPRPTAASGSTCRSPSRCATTGPACARICASTCSSPSSPPSAKGGGLGLPLVAKIVGDHGGIVSYMPGEPGAVFRVRLPAARRIVRPREGASHDRRDGADRRGRCRHPHRRQPGAVAPGLPGPGDQRRECLVALDRGRRRRRRDHRRRPCRTRTASTSCRASRASGPICRSSS